MNKTMRWAMRGIGVVALVAVTVAAIALYPGTGFAQAAEETVTTVTRSIGFGPHGMLGMFGFFGFGGRSQDSALAEALGITTEELNAARDKVFAEQLAQAVADGTITQEEADALLTQRNLARFLADRLQNAYTEAIEAAVEQGIITQEQAGEYLNRGLGRFGVFGGDMGHGLMMGRGMMGRGMMRGLWFDEETIPGRGMMRGPWSR